MILFLTEKCQECLDKIDFVLLVLARMKFKKDILVTKYVEYFGATK
jgi:hypothetical protein